MVSGGFDPLHKGHIQYFTAAKQLGNYLVVGLNSDAWLRRKKGSEFLSIENRSSIVNALEMVDEVWEFSEKDDSNNNSSSMIDKALLAFPDCEIVFANGGDRNSTNIPELEIFKDNPRVKFVFSVGGSNKADSSSWILDKWKAPITERDWGFWKVIDDKKSHKVKELVIRPGCSLSNQRHYKRNG